MTIPTRNASCERNLKLLLRFFGSTSLSALIFVVAPRSWMEAIHSEVGMGTLPEMPVVGYLARSLSAFYALMGGLFWTLSFDVRRYRAVVQYMGCGLAVFGVILVGVDWWERLPFVWKVWEGPVVILLGLFMSFLSRRLDG